MVDGSVHEQYIADEEPHLAVLQIEQEVSVGSDQVQEGLDHFLVRNVSLVVKYGELFPSGFESERSSHR